MSNSSYILAIDEGTTGTIALIVDEEGCTVSGAYREINQIFPQPGWVEQDPAELFHSSIIVAREAVQKAGIPFSMIKGLGITSQRETTIVWDRHTGRPATNAIVWQCRRTAPLCEELVKRGLGPSIRQKTGLPVDAYFSATKLRWILDTIPQGQERACQGDLLFGTVDSWLVWNLTGGKVHITDCTNACRTMLFNIETLSWDQELLDCLDIPRAMMPEVKPSSHIYGETVPGLLADFPIPVGAVIGDQQASLIGQACFEPGMAKNTYGTGSFVLLNTGEACVRSGGGLITTLAWSEGFKTTYALEGSIFVTGAAIQWLRDGLKIIQNAAESDIMAHSTSDNGGVYFIPGFTGLGSPHWNMYARGTIVGLTRGTTREHLARAALEAEAYQARDVIETMESEARLRIPLLRVDGGGTASDFLMQFQSDILGIPLQRAQVRETTGLGAAFLAGLAVDLWPNKSELSRMWRCSRTFEPLMSEDEREALYQGWKRALECTRVWSAH
jgi:glycerol kinase